MYFTKIQNVLKETMFLGCFAISLFSTSLSQADLITGVSIHDVSSELPPFFQFADQIVDGSGLSNGEHTDQSNFTMWLNSGNGASSVPADPTNPSGVGAVVTFDLGSAYDLSHMRIWNYNNGHNSGQLTPRGAKDVEVLSSDDSTSYFAEANLQLSEAPGTPDYEGEIFNLNVNQARYIRFNISSNHYPDQTADAEHVGLAEVQFFAESETSTAVPEPSSILVIPFSLVSVYFARRRIDAPRPFRRKGS